MNLKSIDPRLELLQSHVEPYYRSDDPSHDWAHIGRVVKTCLTIGKKEKAQLQILIPAALLHDIVNLPKNHPQRSQASELAANQSKEILARYEYEASEIDLIAQVVLEHSFSSGLTPSSIESKILQDADRLDAIGAIGTMRWVSCGTQLGSLFYDWKDPLAKNRELDDKKFALDHFYTKLFKIPEKMNTESGKSIAKNRIQFMQNFVEQLQSEIL